MSLQSDERQFRLLMVHNVLWSLGMSLACGFVDAYIMHLGFGMAATLGMHALLLSARFSVRAVMLPLVRRLGVHHALLLGALIAALQFLPLIKAEQPGWLGVWIAMVSMGECIYWPIYHAANAVCGGRGRRGRQIALRQMASTATSVVAPVVGGVLLTRCGPGIEFGVASVLTLSAIVPLFWLGNVDFGEVPTARASIRIADRVGLCAFAADGWISAGVSVAWPMVLFTSLGSRYDALGWTSSVAAIAGSLAGLACGVAIDRGYRHYLSRIVVVGLLSGILLRVAAGFTPWLAPLASANGAAMGGLYVPILMSVIYDRAKRSGSAYQFHLSIEAGWDVGCIFGCLAAAAVALSHAPASFTVLPSALGLLLLHHCVRAEADTATPRSPLVGGAVALG